MSKFFRGSLFVAPCLAFAPGLPHLSNGHGANVAIAQQGINYVKDQALPLIVNYIADYPLPNPIANGEADSIEYKVEDVALSNVALGAEVQFGAPNKLNIHLDIQSLHADAKVSAKETVWPHPSVSAHAHATAKSSSADVILGINVDADKQIPLLGLQSCSTNIDLDISVSGLGILDGIADAIVKDFRGDLEKDIGKALCEAVTKGAGSLSQILTDFSYQQSLGPHLKNATIDFHLTSSPEVVTGPPLYLQVPFGAEFIAGDGSHAPVSAPGLPTLSSAEMGSHMVTVQLSPWPVNTALWTGLHEGLLQDDVHKEDLGIVSSLLTTDYWAELLPKMAERFNTSTDMLIRVTSANAPNASLANKTIGVFGTVLLEFVALPPEGEVAAFTFGSPISAEGEVHLSEDEKAITGSIKNVSALNFSVFSSNFGDIDPVVFTLINPLLNDVVQQTAVPRANDFLAKNGYAIPFITSSDGNLSFTSPVVTLGDGYLLVGTNLVLDLKPGLGSARAPSESVLVV